MNSVSNISVRPKLGSRCGSGRGRILLICHYAVDGPFTVHESISMFQDHSAFNFEVLNLWPIDMIGRRDIIPLDISRFSAIVIHNTVSYNPQNLFQLESFLTGGLSAYPGVKIVIRQDEHHLTNLFRDFVVTAKIDIVLTCLQQHQIEQVYGNFAGNSAKWMTVPTGYVTSALRSTPLVPYTVRDRDLVYRGSVQPLTCGRLGYEKWAIGDEVAAHPLSANLCLDISSRSEDRLSARKWIDFLLNSKAVLGVESGSNLFDFDGEVGRLCDDFAATNPHLRAGSKEFYIRANNAFLHRYEGAVQYGQIAPRHIEAMACRTLMVLYEDTYAGLIQPNVHFFPLKRDLSNFAEAIALIEDPQRWKEMTDAAYEHVMNSEFLSARHAVAQFDRAVEDTVARKQSNRQETQKAKKRVLLLCSHDPVSDPRITWVSSWFRGTATVCQLGIAKVSAPAIEEVDTDVVRIRVERGLHSNVWKRNFIYGSQSGSVAFDLMARLHCLSASPFSELVHLVGALVASEGELSTFRKRCGYLTETNSALLEASTDLGKFDLIVAADLETLPAALALKSIWSTPVIYDAHEFWPASFDGMPVWEGEWWGLVEASLVGETDLRLTVSEPLARHMSDEYGVPFHCAPNAARLEDQLPDAQIEALMSGRVDHDAPVFLFLGGFAKGRGIEWLINIWPKVPRGVLVLQGPESIYRDQMIELARQKGVLNVSVHFPAPVREHELIVTAAAADVGVVPYEPSSLNNRWCCPNKLSQYLAAGLPILANATEYVGAVVRSNDVGLVVDFRNEAQLLDAISVLARDHAERLEIGRRSRATFQNAFNWESGSAKVREAAVALIDSKSPASTTSLNFERLLSKPALHRQQTSAGALSGRRTIRFLWKLIPLRFRLVILREAKAILGL
jgi:glycosyltransferase involved in cell wall biosynthesis